MTSPSTPVALPLRLWFGVEILFGLAAVSAVGLSPADTATNFAWSINAVVMAAVLGAFYLASVVLAVLAVLVHRWEMVRLIVLPLALFTSLQLLVTFLHWDTFATDSNPFVLWFASYLLPPLIFVGAYVWHQRRSGPRVSDQPLPPRLQKVLFVVGGAVAGIAAVILVFPSLLVDRFAWPLTPLTARTFMAWIITFGALLVSMAVENDRARVRIVAPSLLIVLPAVLLQTIRYADQVDWANPALLILLGTFALMAGGGAYFVRGDWQEVLGSSSRPE